MDSGLNDAAAEQLKEDLYLLRGDMYAQDQLLYSINSKDLKGFGGDLVLDKWNPERGTWDDVRIRDNMGSPDIPVRTFGYDDPTPWPDTVQNQGSDQNVDIYVVQSGDSLSKIARDRLAETSASSPRVQSYVQDIAVLNNLENPNKIEVGQRLKMPPLPLR